MDLLGGEIERALARMRSGEIDDGLHIGWA